MRDDHDTEALEEQATEEILRVSRRWVALLPGGCDPESGEPFSPLRAALLRGVVAIEAGRGQSHLRVAAPPVEPEVPEPLSRHPVVRRRVAARRR